MKRALLATIILAVPATALADATFEAKAREAVRVKRIADVVWPLVAACDRGDEVQQRQCRLVRDRKATALVGATLLVDGEAAAFEVGTWNPAKKSTPITLTACVHCGGLELEGRTWHVTGAGTPPRVEGGKLRAAVLHDNVRTFSDEVTASAWRKSVDAVRVQYLVKVPDKRRWQVAGKQGLQLEILGYRVYSPCDGGIVVANPPSQNLEPEKQACTKPAAAPRKPDPG